MINFAKYLFRITICGNADGLIIPHYGIATNEDFVVYFVLLSGSKLDSGYSGFAGGFYYCCRYGFADAWVESGWDDIFFG